MSAGELVLIHTARVREPDAPSLCDGGLIGHSDSKTTLLDPLDPPSSASGAAAAWSDPGRVSSPSSVTQLPLVEDHSNEPAQSAASFQT